MGKAHETPEPQRPLLLPHCGAPGGTWYARNRIQAVLEDTNITLASVASDVFGKSGRRMLDLGRTFRRLEARCGGKKAAVAVAHKILVIVYHLLAEGTVYDEERYNHLQPRQAERQRQRAVSALEQLGYQVSLERVA